MRLIGAALTTLLASAASHQHTRAAAAATITTSRAFKTTRSSITAFVDTSPSSSRFQFSRPRMSSSNTKFSSTASSSDVVDSSDKEALLKCPRINLPNGDNKIQHPAIGFGTYKVGFIPASASSAVASTPDAKVERTAEECVSDALLVGYRFLECAEFYGNEVEVGKAIAKSGIPREELFLCSKVWTTTIEQGHDAIRAQFDKTLADLGTDYLDLYLIHWPVPGKHIEAYQTLQGLVKEGKVRGIGFSNYAVEDYLELKESGKMDIKPVVNQIEINPFLYRKNTIDFFQKEGIVLQSYRSLRDGKAFDDPTLQSIATKHNKSTAQILGKWCVQHGFIYMPKSVKKERMIENAKVFDFTLTEEEMKLLDNLTTEGAIEKFKGLYRKCVNRDTSKDGTLDGVKMDITND